MTRCTTIFHGRSLTFAIIALVLGLAAFGSALNFPWLVDRRGWTFLRQSLVLCIGSLVLCLVVLTNLVLDVKRGYSPNRCSLASAIMLLAFSGPVMLAIMLIRYFSR